MNRYRNALGIRGPTKANASTLCQKCLKRGHYSYECTTSAQDRPYTARPSRSQQLQNPKLRPQLTTEVPDELTSSKGLADQILTKREEERGRKRDLGESDSLDGRGQAPKRARSESSHSMSSVSTISTSRSHSASPHRHGKDLRARSSHERTRSISPQHSKPRKRQYSESSSDDASSYSSAERHRSRSREWERDRNTRRRHRESSPDERGRPRNVSRGGSRGGRTRSRSMDTGRIAKERRSLTPEAINGRSHAGRPSLRESNNDTDYGRRGGRDQGHAPNRPRRERSLSPYSKRLALTQAMNLGS